MTYFYKPKRWTKDESDLAARLRREGLSNGEIGQRLDRTAQSVHRHLYTREHPEQSIVSFRDLDLSCATISRPTPEMMEDRFQRQLMPPRDLTGILMGDPPVGLSALERRT